MEALATVSLSVLFLGLQKQPTNRATTACVMDEMQRGGHSVCGKPRYFYGFVLLRSVAAGEPW
jgi:hypothetical protein